MLEYILYEASYMVLFLLTLLYFLAMYFIGGRLFLQVCLWFESINVLHKITDRAIKSGQIRFEIKHSLKSIFIFGLSIIPIIWLIRSGHIDLRSNTIINVLFALLFLNIYNELHFFIVHRIMHLPFLMKRVHWVHHRTLVPTVYSVYSFHWFEALLLSTVPLSIMPFIGLPPLAVAIYPFTSILLNFAGHCNYRFGAGKGNEWQKLATNHNYHHSKGKQNFGFAIPLFDIINKKIFNKNGK